MTTSPFTHNPAPTAETTAMTFYDIESLPQIFTLVALTVSPEKSVAPQVHIFALADDHDVLPINQLANVDVLRRIKVANPALAAVADDMDPVYFIYDLHNPAHRNSMYSLCGVPAAGITLTADVDPDYDPTQHPFIAGYNSMNYDTVMLALFAHMATEADTAGATITAASMRQHNDNLFSDEFIKSMPSYLREYPEASKIRRAMLRSGRHLDIARLNELQQRVGLKRLLGQLGYQILESDRLGPHSDDLAGLDDLVELIAYNLSDVVGTRLLFADPTYSSSFDLRCSLLRTYPETVFNADPDIGSGYAAPKIDTDAVQNTRLTTDSSSAQFAARILAPYRALADIPGHLADMPVVSLRYPDESVGTPRNILTETRDFLYDLLPADRSPGSPAHTALETFRPVYEFYRSIEGRNFNHPIGGFDEEPPLELGVVDHITTLVTTATSLAEKFARCAPADGQFRTFDALANEINSFIDLQEKIIPAELYQSRDPEPIALTPRELDTLCAIALRICDTARTWHTDGVAAGLITMTTIAPREFNDMLAELTFSAQWLKKYALICLDAATGFDPADDPTVDSPVVHLPPRDEVPHLALADVATRPLNVRYVDANAEPTDCFATFSTGGIHGAQLDAAHYAANTATARAAERFFREVLATCVAHVHATPEDDQDAELIAAAWKWAHGETNPAIDPELIPDITGFTPEDIAAATWWLRHRRHPGKRTLRGVDIVDPNTGDKRTVKHSEVLTTSKAITPYWRHAPKATKASELFVAKNIKREALAPAGCVHNANKLNERYATTSIGEVIHEDFTSYYPLMLTNMAAFANPDLASESGKSRDKYREIFDAKQHYGNQLKDPHLDAETKARIKNMRQGTKLILNAASGAADASHNTHIKMNNRIIAMRIIGQLFSWRIGQAQTAAGASIVSTNTDGLYSMLDFETNQRVLDEHTDAIGVEIEPEPLRLVSKDSNNRVEFTPRNPATPYARPEVLVASGGMLACWDGPNPQKALAHPAIYDRLLVEYFRHILSVCHDNDQAAARMTEPMDRELVTSLLANIEASESDETLAMLYQNILASSPRSNTFLYSVSATELDTVDDPSAGALATIRPNQVTMLQHYNRAFVVNTDALAHHTQLGEPVFIAAAAARPRTKASMADSDIGKRTEPAVSVLRANGAPIDQLHLTHDITSRKHTGVDPSTPVLIVNETLRHSNDPDHLAALISVIDRDYYIDAVIDLFDRNWRNIKPESTESTELTSED